MSSRTFLIINSDKDSAFQRGELSNSNAKATAQRVVNYFKGLMGGSKSSSVQLGFASTADAVSASQTGTFTAAPAESDTVTINGVDITFIDEVAHSVIQDLTFSAVSAGSAGNSISITYTAGATAGSEMVTVVGSDISVQIEDTVSTATQVKDAIDNDVSASALVSVAISGTGSNAQTIQSQTFLSGGQTAGNNEVRSDDSPSNATLASRLAAAINSSTSSEISGLVSASANGDDVAIECKMPGLIGNCILVSASATGFSWAGSALSGGTGELPDLTNFDFSR